MNISLTINEAELIRELLAPVRKAKSVRGKLSRSAEAKLRRALARTRKGEP